MNTLKAHRSGFSTRPGILLPDWPAPANVRALQTLRTGGCSPPPWNTLNLGEHVGDEPDRVTANRAALAALLPADPCWLQQVHGTFTVDAATGQKKPEADASWTSETDVVCAVMTADCLPLLFCDRAGGVVAAAHAGWRGLLNGVIENTLKAMGCSPEEVLVWLGPAIGPKAFEVGDEVRNAFLEHSANARTAFMATAPGKWHADLCMLARQRLGAAGVTKIHGGHWCTSSDPQHFFSYRRDGQTGRMATLIWLTREESGKSV